MRGNYGGRLEKKQMKFPTRIAISLDMNDYEIGVDDFHSEQDLGGENCGYEREFCNGISEDGQDLADVEGEGDDDIYRQLAQKEKDLLLAAELGKALLEKNEEVNQKYEMLQEEYSQVVEVSVLNENFFSDLYSITRDWICFVMELVVSKLKQ